MGNKDQASIKNNKTYILENLTSEILKKTVNPEDIYEIAALLESFGWNDKRVSETFGEEDVFGLSQVIWDMIQKKVSFQNFTEQEKLTGYERFILVVKSFLRGLLFALPMAISVIAMLTLRFSLWSYEYLSTEMATSIALGTILSFMTVGGFTQAIARRGFFYINQGFYNMAKKITFYIVRMGYIACILVSITFLFLNTFFHNFTYKMIFIACIYYLFLNSNWLSVTVMYILQKEFTFTALISFGIFIVFVLFKIFNFNIIFSQIIALIIITIAGLLLVIHFFNRDEKKYEKGIAPKMPKKSIMLYALTPYFTYGFLYFTFLFTDRIMAWSCNNFFKMPYIIWFRGDYELGLDFALLMLIIPMGFSEVIVSRLMQDIQVMQKNSFKKENNELNRRYIKYYMRSLIMITAVSVICAVAVFIIVKFLNEHPQLLNQKVYLFNNVTYFVFITALIAYAVLSTALSNSVILFSLAQPSKVNKVLKYSLVVNFVLGFILSRWIGYYYAVFGLLIGTIIFAAGTCYYVVKVLKRLDYYIYVAS